MPMILPERTVDAWTASYITGRRWRARLWAPTEKRAGERYDLGVGLGKVGGVPVPPHPETWPDKVFVFEHKGVYQNSAGDPVIWVRVRQLLDHLDEDRARGGDLVYFLLPDPEWKSHHPAPYGRLPDVSSRRTRGPKLPAKGYAWPGFQVWAHVAHVEDVRELVAQIYAAEPARLKFRPRGGKKDWACALEMTEVRALNNRVSLRDFMGRVRDCTRGRLSSDKTLLEPQPVSIRPSDLLERSLGEALAATAGEERTEGDVRIDDLEDQAYESKDDDLLEVFDRPAFTTVYGVGDSEQIKEGTSGSSLF